MVVLQGRFLRIVDPEGPKANVGSKASCSVEENQLFLERGKISFVLLAGSKAGLEPIIEVVRADKVI